MKPARVSGMVRSTADLATAIERVSGGRAWRIAAAALAGPGATLAVAPFSTAAGFAAGCLAVACCFLPFGPERRAPVETRPAVETSPTGEARPHAVLDALPDPVLLIDRGRQLVYANETAGRAFGALTLGEAVSLRFRSPEFLAAVEAAFATVEPAKASVAEGRAAGRVWAVDMMPVPVAPDRRPPLLLLLFRDRTAERRIERMRTDFVANASHELRTPLASLIGFIETLQGPARGDAAARDRFLVIMREQAARMSRLIDDLLSLSQIEMKRHPIPGRTVDLEELFEDVRRSLSPMIAESGMEADFVVEPGRYVVDGERDELLQVFSNLVENACKYGSSGGRLILSLHRGHADGADIRASVRDFGPGIAAEHVPRLTERFYRVDVESSRTKRGTGLGLSIVRNILQRHSARLLVESQPGQGSTFSVLFRDGREERMKDKEKQKDILS